MEEAIDQIVKTLSASWPDSLWDHETGRCLNQVIEFQIENAKKGQPSSLPFFSQSRVNWVTFGSNLQSVRLYYSRIKHWCIPCFARGAGFVHPHNGSGDLTSSILALSPAGYFKWESPHFRTETILKKIYGIERLQASMPPLVSLIFW